MSNPGKPPSTMTKVAAFSPSILEPIVKRKPIPRKGHRKSRGGCSVCKRRKVKCDEVTPECGSCRRLGLQCQFQPTGRPDTTVALGNVARPMRSEPPSFTVEDLRFFQHFLFTAYPSLPVGGFDVWQEVGKMSHHYGFLVHAMLGLGASNLSTICGNVGTFDGPALKHRVVAIQQLNEHIARPNLTPADADAAFAALLTLTFQSAYMGDGMVDFFTMVRGCFVVGNHLIPDMDESTFKSFARAAYVAKVQELIGYDETRRCLDGVVADGFCTSLRRLQPLCRSVPELQYLAQMQNIADAASKNPLESYHQHSFLYDRLGEFTPEEFTDYVDPTNYISSLIIMHMITLDFVMSRKDVEDGGNLRLHDGLRRGYDCRRGMALSWVETIYNRLPDDYKPYAEWPINFSRGLTLSFDVADEVWKPFLLTRGKATIPSVESIEAL